MQPVRSCTLALALLSGCTLTSGGAAVDNTGGDVFVVVSQSLATPGNTVAVVEAALVANQAAEGQPGFLEYRVLGPRVGDGPITVITVWASETAFQAWVQSDEFRTVQTKETVRRVSGILADFASSSDFVLAGAWSADGGKD